MEEHVHKIKDGEMMIMIFVMMIHIGEDGVVFQKEQTRSLEETTKLKNVPLIHTGMALDVH
jgi:hypothetical protein